MRYLVSLLATFTLAACVTDVEPETAELEQSLGSPTVIDYKPGIVSGRELFPIERGAYVQLVLVPRSTKPGHYAWGVSNGRVLWVFRVAEADTPDLVSTFHKGWSELMGPGLGDGGGGVTKVPPPPTPPPVPIGEPPWSTTYVARVVNYVYEGQSIGEKISEQLYSGQY